MLAGAVLVVLLFLPLAFIYAGFMPLLLGIGSAQSLSYGGTPLAVVLLLFEFAFLIVALGIVLRLLHQRGIPSLVGPISLAIAQFIRCALYLVPLYLLLLVVPLPESYALSANLAFGLWLAWLPLALICVMIQITAEELIFRGYLQSQLAGRFRHPLIWIALPSLLFGLVHYDTAIAGDNAWMLAAWATLFGLAAADLTARSGTLGPALALHFVNNVFAILVTAPSGDLDGLALYTFPLSLDDTALTWTVLPVETLFTICAWLTARLALRV